MRIIIIIIILIFKFLSMFYFFIFFSVSLILTLLFFLLFKHLTTQILCQGLIYFFSSPSPRSLLFCFILGFFFVFFVILVWIVVFVVVFYREGIFVLELLFLWLLFLLVFP